MGRKPRSEFAGGIYHVVARRVDRWPLFVDEEDYRRYIELLGESVVRFEWSCLSFCLMPNHVHLLIELHEPTLARGMHRLQGMYVRWFNRRHDRVGRLFEDRYRPHFVADAAYFMNVAAYIAMNPVTAKLCTRPEDWRWSSYAQAADWPGHARLLERLEAITGRTDFFDLIVL